MLYNSFYNLEDLECYNPRDHHESYTDYITELIVSDDKR